MERKIKDQLEALLRESDVQKATIERNSYQWRCGALLTLIEEYCAAGKLFVADRGEHLTRGDAARAELRRRSLKIANTNLYSKSVGECHEEIAVGALEEAIELATACGMLVDYRDS